MARMTSETTSPILTITPDALTTEARSCRCTLSV